MVAQPKIAFLGDGFISWTGGIDFLRQCIGSIDSVMPDTTWPVLVPQATPPQRALAFAVATKRRLWSLAGRQSAGNATASKEQLRDAITSAGCRIATQSYYDSPRGLSRALHTLDAQVVLPSFVSLGRHFPHPWIGYIGDLQHKLLPDNFTPGEREHRDRTFSALLADAPAIITISKSVVRDIQEFYPKPSAALFSLPFCPLANPDFLNETADDALHAYDLPKHFFIICNQFWVHKSHQTAFDALRLVRDAGFPDVHILCTGNVHDYRAPGYVDRLKAGIARDGLSDRIRFLGILPKRHQLAMMRRSVALIQPTLFEGAPGGLSVCDAVSTATPVILSDIDANREADLGVIEFFRAGSAEDLAQKMIAMLQNPPARLSAEATLSMLRQRQQLFGATLLEAISLVSGSAAGAVPTLREQRGQ